MTGLFRYRSLLFSTFLSLSTSAAPSLAADRLAQRIDNALTKPADKSAGQAACIVDDAGFLRRLHLDLVGVIPTAEEIRSFVTDSDPAKRDKVIDRLLADSRYPLHMRNRFHTMLMERMGDDQSWLAWLQKSFEQNRPWNQMACEILTANPDDEEARGAAFFVAKRLENYGQNPVDFPGLTRDVGRLFIGQDLQCAQCHDDLFVDDYKQLDFQGLHVVFSNLQLRRDVQFPAVSEKPLREKLGFISVFEAAEQKTGPRLPGGPELVIPALPEEPEGDTKRRKEKTPPTPPVTLSLLASELATADYQPFVKNIANRLWYLMMGRGLVQPLDMHHSGNPASHPELLDELSKEFVDHAFDIKWMLGEIARSKAYQRSSAAEPGTPIPSPDSFLVFNEKRLSSEQLLQSLLVATGESKRYEQADQETPPAEGLAPLNELREQFIAAFSEPPREPEDEINASVKGALFLLNNQQVLQLLNPREGNLADRLSKIEAADKVAEELYLSVLSRYPTDEESQYVSQLLKTVPLDREEILRQYTWALLASVEFYVNH